MEQSKMHQEREADMQKRENDLMIKMSKRMNVMEEQLKEVKTRLSDAVKTIAEKDKELENLKAQVLKEGIEKLSQPKNQKRVSENEQYLMADVPDSTEDEYRDYKNRKPKPHYSKPNVSESLHSVNKAKPLSPKEFRQKEIAEAKNLTDVIEERMMKSKPLQNVESMKERNIESSTLSNSISGIGVNRLPHEDEFKDNQATLISREDFSTDNVSESGISLGEYGDKTSQEMAEEYERLVNQVSEMEKFLADYGLIWVGDANIRDGDSNRKVQATIGFSPNFDKIIMIISEMNDVVSAESHVEVSKKEGKFKKADVLRLKLFADGIQLEDNPFREYSSESVQEFFRDLEEGYYPTELKDIYPDGVIFRVIDKRFATYEETMKGQVEPFSGEGHKLGSVSDGSVERKRKIPPYPGPAGRAKKKINDDEEFVAEVSYEEIKHVKNKNMNAKKSANNLNQINESLKVTSQEGLQQKRGEKKNAKEIPIDFNKRKGQTNESTQEVQGNINKKPSIIEIPAISERSQAVSESKPEIVSSSNSEEFSRGIIQSEVAIKEKVLDNTVKLTKIEEESKSAIPEMNLTENIFVDAMPKENVQQRVKNVIIPIEEKIKTVQEKTNDSGELRFRDNINITNITYHEAPVTFTGPQLTPVSHQSGCLQDSRCSCPAASAEPSRTIREPRQYYDESEDNGTRRKYEYEDGENPYSRGTPYHESSDSKASRSPVTGVTEYHQQYDENAKNIIEAINRRRSTPTPKVQINPNEKYEHFTFLGSDSTINNSNPGQNDIRLDLPSTGDSSKADPSDPQVEQTNSEEGLVEEFDVDGDNNSKESASAVNDE